MFTSIIENLSEGLTLWEGSICTISAVLLGLGIAFVYSRQEIASKNFTITLAMLPPLVQFVIMMVNGNLGTGVAVLGAFSLVRFRSVPGSSKEIIFIFFSMAIGLAIGMGFVSFAAFMTVVISILFLLLYRVGFANDVYRFKELKIIIPEDLDYTTIFDDIFVNYTKKAELVRVKTIQLGAMIETLYHIELKNHSQEKEMLDEIRCRNGNLTIICAKRQAMQDEL